MAKHSDHPRRPWARWWPGWAALAAVALVVTCTAAPRAEVIDRVVATVGSRTVTLSDVRAAVALGLVPAGGGDEAGQAGIASYDLDVARAQAARCVDCGVPGCRTACPLATRIPDWLQAAARGDEAGAAAILAETSALPEVCGALCPQHRLCEGACTRNGEGEGLKNGAVAIGALERWLGTAALDLPQPARADPNGKRVAVIGAGPAGPACADRLVRAGVAVTVYDRNPDAGGLLASGVPPFKLDKEQLARRVDRLQAMGVDFQLGVTEDAERFGELLNARDAVFLGTGPSVRARRNCTEAVLVVLGLVVFFVRMGRR